MRPLSEVGGLGSLPGEQDDITIKKVNGRNNFLVIVVD
jgi:hypothetical protein